MKISTAIWCTPKPRSITSHNIAITRSNGSTTLKDDVAILLRRSVAILGSLSIDYSSNGGYYLKIEI